MNRVRAAFIIGAIVMLAGCQVTPEGDVEAGVPGLMSAKLRLSKKATPTEIQIASEIDFANCLDRQHDLVKGNICICVAAHHDRALLRSMNGFTHCFVGDPVQAGGTPNEDVGETHTLSCPAPAPSECPVHPDDMDAALEKLAQTQRDLADTVVDRDNTLEAVREHANKVEAIRVGCEYLVGKDNYHRANTFTYACSDRAHEIITPTE